MRIDAYNQVAGIYKMNQPKKAGNVAKSGRVNDTLEISETAKSYQTARVAVMNAPEVRAEKVAELKAKIDAGTYSVSGRMIAEKLVEGFFSR